MHATTISKIVPNIIPSEDKDGTIIFAPCGKFHKKDFYHGESVNVYRQLEWLDHHEHGSKKTKPCSACRAVRAEHSEDRPTVQETRAEVLAIRDYFSDLSGAAWTAAADTETAFEDRSEGWE